jgi:hypothetical protein
MPHLHEKDKEALLGFAKTLPKKIKKKNMPWGAESRIDLEEDQGGF